MNLVMLAALASCLALFLQASANPVLQQSLQGSIQGTVTRLGSGQPVPNARVTVTRRPGQPGAAQPNAPAGVRGAAGPPILMVTTDDKGKFAVEGLDEGIYNVQFQANGYVTQRYGRLPGGNGTPVTVTGGEATKEINVALTPAANIGGRVHDPSDQPLVNVPVELLRSSYDGYGRRLYETVGVTRTNDRGEYRMYWVTPGRYYLLAGSYSAGGSPRYDSSRVSNGIGANGSDFPRVAGYAFYPAATEIDNARSLDLQPGADLRAVDVAVMTRARTFAIRGNVIDSSTGKAPLTANVFAEPQGVGLGPPQGATTAPSPAYKPATGTFEIRNLLPGTYSVVAMVESLPPPGFLRPPIPEASGTLTVTVTDSDVNGVTLAVVPGATVVGRLRFDSEPHPQLPVNVPVIELIAIEGSGGFAEELIPGLPDANGNFTVNNVAPGDYRFDFVNVSLNTIGFVKEARLDGADVLSVPLRIAGSGKKQLDLVLHASGGQVTGIVTDLRSQPVPGARVVLVPDRTRFRLDLYRTAATGQMGRFTFARVAPGDYKVFSWESIEENAWHDPEILARWEPRGASIHVSESSDEAINVQMIPAESSR